MTALSTRRALSSFCGTVTAWIAMAAAVHAQAPASARLRFVVEARQLGPVGYRDPVGAMSPDGQWLAYASEGRLRLTQVAGRPVSTLGPRGRITSVVWLPDSRRVAWAPRHPQGSLAWWLVDIASGERR